MAAPLPIDQARYRPHLDGLRAIAVYLVVAFHAGLARATGGFVGVDVFFVLSGYLVTTVLLRDVEEQGRIRLARFYARRVRRLLPAAVVALVVTLVAYSALADPVAFAAARSAAKASFLYVANWFFVRRSADYFATDSAENPFLHFWSLAVEEQFYLAWPLLLVGLTALARRLPGSWRRWVQGAVAVAALGSVTLALAWRGTSLDRAYFGTDTRAYQLLAGALLALTPGVIRRLARRVGLADAMAGVALMALMVVSSSWWRTGPIVRGVATTVAALVVIAGIEAAARGWLARGLGLAPVVYLGRISYGTYLWHWPVIVILREVRPMSVHSVFLVSCLVATGIAALSFELLERPVRTWKLLDRRPLPVAFSGLAVGVLAVLLLVPALPENGARRVAPVTDAAVTSHLTPVPDSLDLGAVYFANSRDFTECVGKAAEACTVHRGRGPHIMLLGDSTMHALVPAFKEMAEEHDLTLSLGTRPGCPWPAGIYVLNAEIRASCRKIKEDLYARVIPALHPDVIFAMDSSNGPGVDVSQQPRQATASAYHDAIVASVPELAADADAVVLIDSLPKDYTSNPRECLATARFVEQCRFQANTEPTWTETLARTVADANPGVRTLDIDDWACPMLPECDAMVGGKVVWWDGQHLAHDYVVARAEDLYRRLVGEGILPP